MSHLKKLIRTVSLNTKQCLVGLPPQLYHITPKTFMGNLGDVEESHPKAKCLLIYSTRKIPFNKFTSSAIKSVIPSSIKWQFLSNYPIQASFSTVVIAVVSFFLTSDFMYRHIMLVLINRCLLNVVFSLTKALNGQSSPKENFYSPHLSVLFGKPCFS